MSQTLFEHINKFISLEPSRFEEMLLFFSSEKFEKKEVLIHAGSKCDKLFFVEEGCLHSYFVDEGGVEKTVKFAIEDWWITDSAISAISTFWCRGTAKRLATC